MAKARITLPIEGMSCASCAATVQEALQGMNAVSQATVNYATARATCGEYAPCVGVLPEPARANPASAVMHTG